MAVLPEAPPAIMLTDPGQEKVAVAAMRLGAAGYLVKDAGMGYLELLPTVIEQALLRHRLLGEREGMLHEARENEERCRKLVELSPDGISVHCQAGFQFINPAGATILGAQSCEELLGRQMLEFIHPDYHQVFSERLALVEERSVELP